MTLLKELLMEETKNMKTKLDMSDPIDFQKTMRKLWSDHIWYTFVVVNSFFHNPDQVPAVMDRLVENQKAIGKIVVPFYGKDAGDKLGDLLIEHIKLAVPVLEAAKDGDSTALKSAKKDWFKNAAEIADLLGNVNIENWLIDQIKSILEMHIKQTIGYSTALMKNNFQKAIKEYDAAFEHMMHLADIMSTGIIDQFPDKFKS